MSLPAATRVTGVLRGETRVRDIERGDLYLLTSAGIASLARGSLLATAPLGRVDSFAVDWSGLVVLAARGKVGIADGQTFTSILRTRLRRPRLAIGDDNRVLLWGLAPSGRWNLYRILSPDQMEMVLSLPTEIRAAHSDARGTCLVAAPHHLLSIDGEGVVRRLLTHPHFRKETIGSLLAGDLDDAIVGTGGGTYRVTATGLVVSVGRGYRDLAKSYRRIFGLRRRSIVVDRIETGRETRQERLQRQGLESFRRGLAALRRRDYNEAWEDLEKRSIRVHDRPPARLVLGLSMLRSGSRGQAFDELQRYARSCDRKDLAAALRSYLGNQWLRRACRELAGEAYSEAARDLESAAAAGVTGPEILHLRGVLSIRQGKLKEAEETFYRLKNQHPSYESAHVRAVLDEFMARSARQAASRRYEDDLEVAQRLRRAFDLHRGRRWNEAEAIYERLVSSGAGSFPVHFNRGLTRLWGGRTAAAFDSLETAVRVAPPGEPIAAVVRKEVLGRLRALVDLEARLRKDQKIEARRHQRLREKVRFETRPLTDWTGWVFGFETYAVNDTGESIQVQLETLRRGAVNCSLAAAPAGEWIFVYPGRRFLYSVVARRHGESWNWTSSAHRVRYAR